ncbi:MAG: hypothetical protein R3244_01595 [Thermoanaerobaculia bacterium]|nr:hypothetical protein [Thermoanaerobaculia bacterium]
MENRRGIDATPKGPRAVALWRTVASCFALLAVLAGAAAQGSDVELILDNDYGSSNQRNDDLYTFGIELHKDIGAHRFAFSERAFTDKPAGVRFDETELRYEVAGTWRRLPRWDWRLTGGLLHVGRGALGQDLQNRLHEVLENRQRELSYLPSSFHPLVELRAARAFRIADEIILGPHLEASVAPGHKATALAAVRGAWRYRDESSIRFMVGARTADASTEALEPHLSDGALAWELSVDLFRGFFLTWSRNRYGTTTGHIGFGYRFGTDPTPHPELSREPVDR